jgi:hypothetical protein
MTNYFDVIIDVATGETTTRPFTPEEIVAADNRAATRARQLRTRLLTESDWTQVLDAPVERADWASYRQSLRDITAQEGFPHNIIWPKKPGEV